jgi:hypothetical protein
MEASGIDMGEITYIKAGRATTIHDDGSTSSKPVDQCDQCGEWVDVHGGFKVRDVGQEVVIWLCAECRA